MTNFFERLRNVLGQTGYDTSVRRSVQSAVIFEAYRSLEDQLPTMRPFQRKLAVLDQAKALVDAMAADVVPPHQRVEILWRTVSSKEHLDSEAIWKRAKTIEKELKLLAERIQPHWAPGKDHSQTVNEYVQRQYEEIMERGEGVPAPQGWEHSHNNHLMAFRMYYKGPELDSNLPAPVPIKDVVVPVKKKSQSTDVPYMLRLAEGEDPPATSTIFEARQQAAELRRGMLKEVRLHLDLLKEFEGLIPEGDLQARKRQLFLALPQAPPPAVDGKRQKTADDSSSRRSTEL